MYAFVVELSRTDRRHLALSRLQVDCFCRETGISYDAVLPLLMLLASHVTRNSPLVAAQAKPAFDSYRRIMKLYQPRPRLGSERSICDSVAAVYVCSTEENVSGSCLRIIAATRVVESEQHKQTARMYFYAMDLTVCMIGVDG